MFMPISIVYQPVFGWLIMTMDWKYTVLGFVYSPWRLYIVLSSLINAFAYLIFIFLPESPKFMLAMGKQKEALDILIIGYKANGGKGVRFIRQLSRHFIIISNLSFEDFSSEWNFTRIDRFEFSRCSWNKRNVKTGVEANMAVVQTTVSYQHIVVVLPNFCGILCGSRCLHVVSPDFSSVLQ